MYSCTTLVSPEMDSRTYKRVKPSSSTSYRVAKAIRQRTFARCSQSGAVGSFGSPSTCSPKMLC